MSSRQRVWASAAHEQISGFKGGDEEAKLRTLCMKTPSLIHQSGLAQALIFLQSREKEIGKRFVKALAAAYAPKGTHLSGEELVKKALNEDSLQGYMVLTSDISDVAAWMRRFAQIELKKQDGGQ